MEIISSERKALESPSLGNGTRASCGTGRWRGGECRVHLSGREAISRSCLRLKPLSLLFVNLTSSETVLCWRWWGVSFQNSIYFHKKSSWKIVSSQITLLFFRCVAAEGWAGEVGRVPFSSSNQTFLLLFFPQLFLKQLKTWFSRS